MASGIAGHISMTARRWDRRAIPNARLIRLRKAGLFYPERAMPSARAWLWKQWISAWFAAIMG